MDDQGSAPWLTPKQFQFMADHTREELFLVRRDGTFAWVNQAAADSLGYARDELHALRLADVDVDPGRLLPEPPTGPFEATHLTKDGRRLLKEVHASRMDVDGLEAICLFARDVSARRRSEAELAHVARLYALLSQLNHSVVHVKSRAALFEGACKAAIDFGFRMAWVGLVDPVGLVRPVAQAGHVEGYLDQLTIDVRSEVLSLGPTGTAVREGRLDVCADIAAEHRMAPWFGPALQRGYHASAALPLRTRGRVVGALNLYAGEPGFFSERECQLLRQVGEDLSFALEVLDSAAEQELLRAQLQQARKLESVGRLAGGVAHDFNNLLSVILGSVEVALDSVSPEHPAHEALEEGRDAVLRSVDLTRQLLTFARRQPRSLAVLELNTIVGSTLKLLGRLVGEGITLAWRPGPELWSVRADPSQVDQLLTNLCVNARDAMNGSGTITLSTQNLTLDQAAAQALTLSGGSFVTLTVADTGVGMTEEVVARLFEPFFTTKPVGQGTGLGLATVYGIVKQSGGHIAVDSAPGRGSTFTLYLPRHESEKTLPLPAPAGRGPG